MSALRETKREQILHAALEVFAEQGYERATVQDIATNAGVGKGTTYEYFKSKEELFYEVIKFGLKSFFNQLIKAVEKQGTAYERVKNMYAENLAIYKKESLLKEIMLNNMGKIPPKLQQWVLEEEQKMVAVIEKVVEEGKKKNELKNIHSKVLASTILHTMNIIYFYQLREGETLEDVMREQLKIFFNNSI